MPTQQRAPRAARVREQRDEAVRRRSRRPARQEPPLPPVAPTAQPASAAGRSWLADLRAGSGLNAVAGTWLVVAPFVLGYAAASARLNDVVVGAAIALLAMGRLARPARTPELSWLNAALGLWLFLWSLWSYHSDAAMWNDLIVGGLVFLAAMVSASASETGLPDEPNGRRGGAR